MVTPPPPQCAEPADFTMRPDHSKSFGLYNGGGGGCSVADPDFEQPMKWRATKQPEHGTLTLTNHDNVFGADALYVPEQGYTGSDSFSYVAYNAGGDSNEVTQHISLDPDYNRAPDCSPTAAPTLRVGGSRTVQLNCFDPDGDPLTFSVDRSGARGDVSDITSDSGDADTFPFPGSRFVKYTAPGDAGDGHDTFSYTATDDRGAASTAVQNVDVHPSDYDTAPHCGTGNPYGNQVENGSSVWIWSNCSDDERDQITYAVVEQPSHGTVSVRYQGESLGRKLYSFDYRPTGDYVGDDSFSFRATDDHGESAPDVSVAVKVVAPQPPSCLNPPSEDLRTGRQRGMMLYCFGGAFFGGGEPKSYAIVTEPAHGSVTFPEGNEKAWVVYKPDDGYEGTDSFTYRAKNAAGDSNVVTQQLTMSATHNKRPYCDGYNFDQVRTGSSRDITLACWDEDGDPLTYTTTDPAHGSLGEVQQPPPTELYGLATVRYTPDAGFVGRDSFTVKVSDGLEESDVATVPVDVVDAASNHSPRCWSGADVKVAANSSYSFGKADMPCWDQDSDPLDYQITRQPSHGTLTEPDASGNRTYTPTDPNWTGEDSFSYTASDGRATSGEGDIVIDVTDPVAVTAEPRNLPSGEAVTIENYVDAGGKSLIALSRGDVRQFPGSCMPLDVDTTIPSGSGSVSNAKLVLAPDAGGASERFDMTRGSGDAWSAHIDCVKAGALSVEWDFAENGSTTPLSKPLGGIVLIDPQGVVYDKDRYDAATAAGMSPDAARDAAAIEGASVELQRFSGGAWTKVVSGDPGISPNVNPQVTKADGVFRWDVSAGKYRVVVTRPGYEPATSAAVDIPPPVTTLDVAMTRSAPGAGGGTGNGGNEGGAGGGGDDGAGPGGQPADDSKPPNDPGQTPTTDPKPPHKTPKPPPCHGLKGKKKAQCESKQRLKQALAKCSKLKGKKRATCVKRARARAKCDSLSGRKKRACVRRANAIGARKP